MLPTPVGVVYARPRTFFSIAIGILTFLLLPDSLRPLTRFLIGWDVFASSYLGLLAYVMMWRCDQQRTSAATPSCRTTDAF